MNDFQLIAIKPLSECNIQFSKRLLLGKPYYFYQGYRILQRDGTTEQIDDNKVEVIPRIYDLERKDSSRPPLYVQLSAVAGKNGSGKSTLIELLYVALYNLSFDLELLEPPGKDQKPYARENGVAVDIYFRKDDYYYRLRADKVSVRLLKFTFDKLGFDENEQQVNTTDHLKELFYSVVVNYSQYGLNTEDLGPWVRAIFHKNDGYQTPIVLNPYRDKGNININSENYLVKARLLVNIVENKDYVLQFDGSPKVPEHLYFKFDHSKVRPYGYAKIIKLHFEYFEKSILPILYQFLYRLKNVAFDQHALSDTTKKYIFLKLIKISRKYEYYKDYREFYLAKNEKELIDFLDDIAGDPSHITFKLRQAMNFLRFNKLFKSRRKKRFTITELRQAIADIHLDHPTLPTIDLIPPSFFSGDIEFSNADDSLSKLSSGEKQKTYALASLVYHLRNLDSVRERSYEKNNKLRLLVEYDHINIVFDEVELYYHPELQRRFIKDLLDNIKQAELSRIKSINFLFITHSPFILSDIPSTNILYLTVEERETISKERTMRTFGGNIHDLLANSFFLDQHGYLGEFAKGKINSAVNFMRKQLSPNDPTINLTTEDISWEQDSLDQFIDLIGEPLLSQTLRDLYVATYSTEDEIDAQIRSLERAKRQKQSPK